MGYRVYYNFSDGRSEDLLDEVFATEEEAEEAAREGASNYSQGRDYLEEAGEDYCEETIEDWDIVEELKKNKRACVKQALLFFYTSLLIFQVSL